MVYQPKSSLSQIDMFSSPEFKTVTESLRSIKRRSNLILFCLLIFSLAGFYQILNLTIVKQENYTTESNKNSIIILPIYPARGLIVSAEDNSLLVENIVSQKLVVSIKNKDGFEDTINSVRKLVGLNQSQKNNFLRELAVSPPSQQFITLAKDLTDTQVAKFLLNKDKWPRIKLDSGLKRYVIDSSLFSHALGYLGPVSKEEQQDSENFKYLNDSKTGKTGLEKYYENELRGTLGYKTLEIDVFGREVRELERVLPTKAKDIYLSLDRDLQIIARNGLKGRKGAVVALDPNTGFIKVLISSPDYDPNLFNKSATGDVDLILSNKDAPFFNRAISGNYPPASTLKPFLGLLGLESGVVTWNTEIEDNGFFQIEGQGRRYRGWKEEGHGIVNLNKAIIESSDVYFYELAAQLTVDRISPFLENFGFGKVTHIDLDAETSGVLPSRKWKLGSVGDFWFVGDTINLGIGQGFISISPIQLAVAVSALATKGTAYKPSLVEKINDINTMPEILYKINLKKDVHWKRVEGSMVSVINSWNGTAHNLYEERLVNIAGKTGTAQIKSLTEEDLTVQEEYEGVRKDILNRDHALFVSYGPVPKPNLTVVVIVENGESGSAVAAPIAKSLIDAYQKKIKENG